MGLQLGGSYGQTSSSSTGQSQANQVYSPIQSAVQSQIGRNLGSSLDVAQTGGLSPGTRAMETQAADSINKQAGGLTDRVNQFLSSRGFGKSGATGKAAVQSEVGRMGALGANEANFAGMQQQINAQNLLAALNYAFTSLGQTASGRSTGQGTQWGTSVGVGAGIPGF